MSTSLEKAQAARAAMIAQGVQQERLNPAEKQAENPRSLRLSINAKCWDCSCGQRSEIRDCAIKSCALWHVRPYQSDKSDDKK